MPSGQCLGTLLRHAFPVLVARALRGEPGGDWGELAVSFAPTASGGTAWEPRPVTMPAHAVVYADGEHSWVPGQRKFVELMRSPKVPNT